MIDREQFELIGDKHGNYASWAVWAAASERPKSNVWDLSVFDAVANPALLETLKNDIVMVGLNIARPLSKRFGNFHDPSPKANDFKIRHAFTNTTYYGAYMTDIVKNVEMTESTALLKHLRANPSLIRTNVDRFREELQDLHARTPTILAFGLAAHALLAKNLYPNEYSCLIRLTHYAYWMGKERYREAVLSQIRTAELLTYSRLNDRVCPQPQRWQALWEMLPDRKRAGSGWQPSVPLILAAWHDTPAILKMARLAEHIEWAAAHGALP